jgi:hypothetical protein
MRWVAKDQDWQHILLYLIDMCGRIALFELHIL